MLTNAYLLAKIGADTAENEQHFAEILPKTGIARPLPSSAAGEKVESGVSRAGEGGERPCRGELRALKEGRFSEAASAVRQHRGNVGEAPTF